MKCSLTSLVGVLWLLAGAAACSRGPEQSTRSGVPLNHALQGMFVLYGVLGLISIALYRRLSLSLSEPHETPCP